jgi:hypothetical protein
VQLLVQKVMQMAINNSPTMVWQPKSFSSFSCKLQTADAAADRNKSTGLMPV